MRIDDDVLDKLHQEANRESVPFNALVNRALKRYVNWYAHIPKNGNICVWKATLIALMGKYSLEEITDLSRKIAKRSYKDTVLITTKGLTRDSILQVIQEWTKTNFVFESEYRDGAYKYLIHHDMGEKWSAHLAATIHTLLEQAGVKNYTHQITDSTVRLNFDL